MQAKAIAAVFAFTAGIGLAQAPVGAVVGVVSDPSGAAVAGARVQAVSLATGVSRTGASDGQGDYSFPALLAGEYEISAEAPGFQVTVRNASVEAGATTTANLALRLGEAKESVTVYAATPQMQYESHQVSGLVSRSQIETLPLNGRSVLELAKLEPGVSAPVRTSFNRVLVPELGSPGGQAGSRTRVTVDGGSVMAINNGGATMGFSQEVVQEFQMSTVNFDLSTGVTASGAVNIITRSGGNELHGSGFFFFRDHNLAAYPALQRDPSNPDPFFQRKQFGFAVGGPVQRDRLFFFANLERTDQRSVVSVQPQTQDFAAFSQIAPSPSQDTQGSVRLDLRASQNNYAFLRLSHDGFRAFAPSLTTTTAAGSAGSAAVPANWTNTPSWVDQILGALTSSPRPNLVNDLRFSYLFVSNGEFPASAQDCPGSCIGLGAPDISVPDARFEIGRSSSQSQIGRRYHLSDGLSWQKGAHWMRVGGDWEHYGLRAHNLNNEPVTMTLFSPDAVRRYNANPQTPPNLRIPLPASFTTVQDILQLPLQGFTVGIGDASVFQKDFGTAKTGDVTRLYFQDAWRLSSGLMLNLGLGWSYDPQLNYDLSKPAYLIPILGAAGLNPSRKYWKDFSPLAGFTWAPARDGKTLIRGGAAIYYDPVLPGTDGERVSLGPRGVGRANFAGSGIPNPVSGIPGVPLGTPLIFQGNPTLFTGSTLMNILAAVRAGLLARRGDPNNRDFSVRNIELDKQGQVFPYEFPTPYGMHFSVGAQREIARDLVITVDFVYRRFIHTAPAAAATLDLNHTNSNHRVMPRCSAAQMNDPQALCSAGPILVNWTSGRARYEGLLIRVDKRFSRHVQFLGSYALSSSLGINAFTGSGFNLDNPFESYGPIDGRDQRHILSLSGLFELPKQFQLSFITSFASKYPFSPYLGAGATGLDLNGDGIGGDILPGAKSFEFNRSLDKSDLVRLVNDFNANYAGKKDAGGRTIPAISLPASYDFGDYFFTQDLRLTRSFALGRERYRLTLIGEVFNVFNRANLIGYDANLLNRATFGQPSSRVAQAFGSGGPRAFQLACRMTF